MASSKRVVRARPVRVVVRDILKGPLAISSSDGQGVHDVIQKELRSGKSLKLDFDGISTLTSAFLNACVGQLLGEFRDSILRRRLRIVGLVDQDLALLKRVVDSAKAYFRDPTRFARIQKDVLGPDVD